MRQIISARMFLIFALSLLQAGCTLSLGNHPAPPFAPPAYGPGPIDLGPAGGYRDGRPYYYYPESKASFDVGVILYVYPYRGAWHAGVSFPSGHMRSEEYHWRDMEADNQCLDPSNVKKAKSDGTNK